MSTCRHCDQPGLYRVMDAVLDARPIPAARAQELREARYCGAHTGGWMVRVSEEGR